MKEIFIQKQKRNLYRKYSGGKGNRISSVFKMKDKTMITYILFYIFNTYSPLSYSPMSKTQDYLIS